MTEQLYAAFADMPQPRQIYNPYGDLQAGEVRQLTTEPLRELSAGLLFSYLLDAVYTVGTWDDFRYFLPRMLELIASRKLEADRVVWRLRYAEEHQLPFTEQQKEAMHTFGLVYWHEQVKAGVTYSDIEEWQALGLTRAELLDAWLQHPDGAVWIANTVVMGWGLQPEWNASEIRGKLECAFHASTDPKDAQLLSDAILILEAMSDH